ncbi:MAG TPA: tartrate-resistant acid phosphatase type 5 family protein [Flavisolibacter sp.]
MSVSFKTGAGFFLMLLAQFLCPGCRPSAATAGSNKISKGDSLSFIVVGDWGKGKGAQRSVARSMDKAAKIHNTRFIISTGDNFYYKGVRSTGDKQWKKKFERVYWRASQRVPWYAVLGNHDYGLNPQAQVDYTKISDRWEMPARFYRLNKAVDSTSEALFVFLDTSPFLRGYHTSFMSDLAHQDTLAQKAWMAETLKPPYKGWKIVVGHHPVYSAGLHGSTPELGYSFPALFKASGTDFYLSGHDHSLQYLEEEGAKTAYLVSAGGSEKRRVTSHRHARFARSMTGFLVMTLYSDSANFYFYNRRGALVYRNTVKK